MKFTPSSIFNSVAAGGPHQLAWDVYLRKTSTLSQTITGYSGWTKVSDRIDVTSLDTIQSDIEYDLGQFKSTSLNLVGKEISWWDANIFDTASSAQYLELKVETTFASLSDTAVMFSGVIDRDTTYDELSNTVTFAAYTLDEMISRLPAELLGRQYINPTLSSITLASLPGIQPVSANVTNFIVPAGNHVVTFSLSSDNSTWLKLDDGNFVNVGNGYNWILNGISSYGLSAYVALSTLLTKRDFFQLEANSISDSFIVKTTTGDALPYNWPRNISAKQLLNACFNQVGLTAVTFDASMEIPTYDGNNAFSWIGTPPDDFTVTGSSNVTATSADGTMYMMVGSDLYRRDIGTENYTKLVTTALNVCNRMMLDEPNKLLWLYRSSGARVSIYNVGTSSLTDNVSVPNATSQYNADAVTANGGLFIWVAPGIGIRKCTAAGVTGSICSLAELQVGYGGGWTLVNWGQSGPTTGFHYSATQVGATSQLHHLFYNGTKWLDSGGTDTNTYRQFTEGAINHADNVVYYTYDNGADQFELRSIPVGGNPLTQDIPTAGGVSALGVDLKPSSYFYGNDSNLYCTISSSADKQYTLRKLAKVGGTPSAQTLFTGSIIDSGGRSLSYGGSRLHGASRNILWQYGNKVSLFVKEAQAANQSIRDVINKVCQGLNLVYTVSPMKHVYVYKRNDPSGNAISTGNTVTADITNTSALTKEHNFIIPVGFVKASNGVTTWSYDGTTWNSSVLSNVKTLDVSNDWIGDEVVRHLVYHMYQFFKTGRNVYDVELGLVPYFQYEPFDAVQLNYLTNSITSSSTGIIYGFSAHKDGSVNMKVLV